MISCEVISTRPFLSLGLAARTRGPTPSLSSHPSATIHQTPRAWPSHPQMLASPALSLVIREQTTTLRSPAPAQHLGPLSGRRVRHSSPSNSIARFRDTPPTDGSANYAESRVDADYAVEILIPAHIAPPLCASVIPHSRCRRQHCVQRHAGPAMGSHAVLRVGQITFVPTRAFSVECLRCEDLRHALVSVCPSGRMHTPSVAHAPPAAPAKLPERQGCGDASQSASSMRAAVDPSEFGLRARHYCPSDPTRAGKQWGLIWRYRTQAGVVGRRAPAPPQLAVEPEAEAASARPRAPRRALELRQAAARSTPLKSRRPNPTHRIRSSLGFPPPPLP